MLTSIPSALPRAAFIALLGLTPLAGRAQVAAPTWAAVERSAGSGDPSDYAQATKVAVAADGSRFVSGAFDGTMLIGGTTLTSGVNGETSLFLAKYNPNGTLAWVRQGTASSHADPRAVVSVDAAGNAYVTGNFTEFLHFGSANLTTQGNYSDAYVLKFDGQGTVLWARAGGVNNGAAYALDCATDAAGNVYLTGDFTGSLGFGGPAVTPLTGGSSDVFVCKLSAAGTAQWLRAAGSPNSDVGNAIAVDAAGNAYVTGTISLTATFGTLTLGNSAGEEDLFLAKYDTQGNAVWARRAGGSNYDRGTAVALDEGGNVAVAGTADYSFSMNGDQSSIYVARYNSQGTLAWEQKVTPTVPGLYAGYGLAFDHRGGLYMTGELQGQAVFGATTLSTPSSAAFLVRYDALGHVVWADAAGQAGASFGAAIGLSVATDAQGNAYLGGAALGTVQFGTIQSQSSGVGFVLAKLNAGGVITAARPARVAQALSVYPNPATDQTTLLLPAGGGHLVLTDALGRTVREQVLPVAAGPCSVSVSGLTPGIYQLRAALAGGQVGVARLTVR